jgi:hypothetical protein
MKKTNEEKNIQKWVVATLKGKKKVRHVQEIQVAQLSIAQEKKQDIEVG